MNNQKKSFWIKNSPYLIMLSLALFVYIQNLWFDFNYIDDNLIVFDEYSKINSLSRIPQSFVNGYLFDNYYRPVVMISFIFDTAIAGQSSMMYHLTNIILHILTSFLLFQILCRLGINKNITLFSSVIYIIHPLNISAVSWIVGRNDLLLALFSAAGLLFYMKYKENQEGYNLVLSLTAYLFAMLSKEAGVLLPVLLLTYEILLGGKKPFRFSSLTHLLYFIIPAVMYYSLRQFIASINVREEINIISFVQNIYILFEYLSKTIYFFYINPLPVKNQTLIWTGIFVFILMICFILFSRKDKMIRIYLFGFSLFFIFVSPTLFVRVPADDGIFNYIDSRMYLPLLGLMLCFSVLIERISPKINRTLLTIVFSAIVIYSMTFAFLHNQVYKNGETYWTAALKNNPDRATYWMGLGYYYLDNKMYPKAELCVLEALKLRPENADYYHKASVIFEANGDLYRSNELLEKALPYEKDKAQALLVITKNYLRLKDKEQAAHFTSEIEKIDMKGKNKAADIFSSLAYFYSYSGYYNEAILQMKKAIQFQPQNSRFINDLGAFFFSSGKIDSAKLYFNKALTLEPTNNEYRHNLLLSEKKSHL